MKIKRDFMTILIFVFSLNIAFSAYMLDKRSIQDVVIYNMQNNCRSCATVSDINTNYDIYFTECKTEYYVNQRFDIEFNKFSFFHHNIKSK